MKIYFNIILSLIDEKCNAQAWLVQYAADLSAQHNKAKAEATCLAGVPPRADKTQRAARDGSALISALPALHSSPTPS
ncbi:MAG: hypothetical protein KGL44_05735 [Sphingomonadales bacterium]|nr:hypothetical protein [Sphingomonadales bacterium]